MFKFKPGDLLIMKHDEKRIPFILLKYHQGNGLGFNVKHPWEHANHWKVLMGDKFRTVRADWVEQYCEKVK